MTEQNDQYEKEENIKENKKKSQSCHANTTNNTTWMTLQHHHDPCRQAGTETQTQK